MELALCLIFIAAVFIFNLRIGKEARVHPILTVLGTVLLGPFMTLILLFRRAKPARSKSQRRSLRERILESIDLEDLQRYITIPLYISLISHSISSLLLDLDILEGVVPVLQTITVVTSTLFFLAEAVIVSPLGLVLLTVVAAALFLVLPYVIAFTLGILVEGLILLIVGGFIAVATMSLVVTVVNGTVASVALVPMITFPMIIGGATVGATAVVSTGIAVGVDSGMQSFEERETMNFRHILVNFLLLFLLIWPMLTLTGAFPGIVALKPVLRARREHLHFVERNVDVSYRAFFESEENGAYINGEKDWTFGEGFYDSYIYPGRNTFAQGAYPAASNGQNIAFCLNGMIYLHDSEANETYLATAYDTGRDDAIVMVGKDAFLFGNNRILLLGRWGRYRWKDTKWRSEFNSLSQEEKYDRLYAILEAQNDGLSGTINIEDVAVVAYAQRNGLLLYYDSENHHAYFGQEGKKGQISILRQSSDGKRREVTSFTPNCDSENLPYTMINNTVVAYIDGDKIMFQGVGQDWKSVHYTNKSHDGEPHPFVSFHVFHDEEGTEFFVYVDSEDMACAERLGDEVREIQFDTKRYNAVYSVGTDLYAVIYDNNLLTRLTYFADRRENTSVYNIWTEKWRWVRARINNDLWPSDEPEETEPTIPREERPFDERYPAPKTRTSVQSGLYKDNVASPTQFERYWGPAKGFSFSYPDILYDNVEYTWSEDETEVRICFSCNGDPSSLIVTLRPNAEGMDHQTLMKELQKQAREEMADERVVRSGLDDAEGTSSSYYLRGYDANNTNLIYTRLCRVNSEYIMEMELRIPAANGDMDKAYKEFYIMAMESCCGFGSGDEYTPFWKFKKKYVD